MFVDEISPQLFPRINADNHPMPSGPALEAAMLDDIRRSTWHIPSGSAREAILLDNISRYTRYMLSLSAFIVEKPANAIMDCTETPESYVVRVGQYGPLTPPMLHGSARMAARSTNAIVDLTETSELKAVGVGLYHPWVVPMPSGPARNAAKFANPKADWKEIPEAYIVVVDLPGLDNDQVKLEVEKDRILSISGVWSAEKLEEEDKNYTRLYKERSSGEFLRRFQLPEDAKMDHIRATMGNGVLTVTVPKEKAKIIKIFDGAKMDQNDVLSVKTIDKGIDKGKGVMGIVIGQVKQRRGFKLM